MKKRNAIFVKKRTPNKERNEEQSEAYETSNKTRLIEPVKQNEDKTKQDAIFVKKRTPNKERNEEQSEAYKTSNKTRLTKRATKRGLRNQ